MGGSRPGAGRRPGSRNVKPREADPGKPPLLLTLAEEKRLWRIVLGIETPRADEKLPPTRELREALQYVNEMRRGKPYMATNPRARKSSGADPKFMIAIQNLLPGGSKRSSTTIDANTNLPKRRTRKPRALPESESDE